MGPQLSSTRAMLRRHEVIDLLQRYCLAVDGRRPEALAAVLAPDVRFLAGDGSWHDGAEAVIAHFTRYWDGEPAIGLHTVEDVVLGEPSGQGQAVTAVFLSRVPVADALRVVWGRYEAVVDDDGDDGLRLGELQILVDGVEQVPTGGGR